MREQGTVKWFNHARGYGFVAPDSGGVDVFVHYSEIRTDRRPTLDAEQRVEFAIRQGHKSPVAQKVRPL